MALKDSGDRFGGISIVNHWTMAILVVGMLAFGLYIEDLRWTEETRYLLQLHKSVGILVLVLAVWRILWRMYCGFPDAAGPMKAWESFLARAVHYALLVGVLIMSISGYVRSAAGGHPVDFFGLFSLPGLSENKALSSAAAEVHEVAGTLLIVLIALHVLAAMEHHFIDRDGTLRRMIGKAG